MTAEYKNWQEEFVDINFTDQRLKSRFFKIIDAFAASPGKSTWAATGSRSSAKAAYRFFSNSEISKDELLDSISRATVEKIKCADAEWILAVQDTTAVGFGDRKAIQGMGYYCSTEQRGMLVHSCIAVTDQGIPLGIIYQETNTREKPKDDSQTKEQKRSRPIEEKENFRWLDSMCETLLRMPADIPILTVCDREGDFYEFFPEAADLKANFLIRIVQNRMVDDGKKIFHELRSSPVAGSMVVRMSRNPREHIPSRNIKMGQVKALAVGSVNPEGVPVPSKDIINKPDLQVYVKDFGENKGDLCLVAQVADEIVGAVWVRIMNDYGHIDNETPSFAISLLKEYRNYGIGTELMKQMLTKLKLEGYKQASLSVQKMNYAVRMYRKI